MKKFLTFLLIFLLVLVMVYQYLVNPNASPLYVSPKDEILSTVRKKENKALAMIQRMNKTNSPIKNMSCARMDIKFKHNISAKLTGSFALEKEKRFRMLIYSILGKEMDIGSNDTLFWFWSKRGKPPVLNYAHHSNFHKTSLKTPLNPVWMMETFNIGAIDTKNSQIGKVKGFWAIFQERKSSLNELVTRVILIDPSRELVIGHYLYNSKGKLVASTEIKEFQQIGGYTVPKNVVIIWYGEGIRMEWSLSDVQLNVKINPETWQMPKMRRSINIGEI